MSRVRALLILVALVPMARAAHAQPVDPYEQPKAPAAPKSPAPARDGSAPKDPYADEPAPAKRPAPAPAPAPAKGRAPKATAPSDPYGDAAAPAPGTPPARQPPAARGAGSPSTPPAAAPAPAAPGPGGPRSAPAPAGAPAPAAAAGDAPQDPYGPAPVSSQDPVLAERVAEALVARAQELLDGRVFLDAKQLAVEALVRSPRGAAAERARTIIRVVNRELGIPEDSPRPVASTPPPPAAPPVEDVDTSPIQDPTVAAPPVAAPPEGGTRGLFRDRIAATVHGGLYAGLLGATIGSFFSDDTPAAGAVPVGIAAGVAGGVALPMVMRKLGWTEAQTRTVGAATVWGGMIGGLLGDVAKLDDTSAREVLVAASVGSTLLGLGGAAMARKDRLTRGDVALIDTLAGMGAAGGLTLGMVMQPAESEAYSLNAALGIAGGVLVGYVAAPMTNTTPRRMLRVAGLAAVGGAAPFLLYAAIQDGNSNNDERLTGLLSTGGLVIGALVGFRLTREMDDGLDTFDGDGKRKDADDAPVALVSRTSSGRWGIGGLGLSPLSRQLAPQPGLALQLVGATF